MKMNLNPALRYQSRVIAKEVLIAMVSFFSILVVSFLLTALLIGIDGDVTISVSGFGIMLLVFMFVSGIVNTRNNLRFNMQFGISRKTTFISELIVIIPASLVLAIFGQLFLEVERLISGNGMRNFFDIYYLIFTNGGVPTLAHRVSAVLVNAGLQFAIYIIGMFFSLGYWRLGKAGSIIASVVMVFLINAIPIAIFKLGINVAPFFSWLGASPVNFVGFWLIIAAVVAVINWLLLRKANIKPAK